MTSRWKGGTPPGKLLPQHSVNRTAFREMGNEKVIFYSTRAQTEFERSGLMWRLRAVLI